MRVQTTFDWFAIAVLVSGLVRAATRWWTCDDAYIHFRYSDNFARGHGLVWNVGERVEGYVTVLWNVLLAGGIRLGFDPRIFANLLGLTFFAALLGLLWLVARRLPLPGGIVVPLAAIGVAWHGEAQVFATSGMETMMFTFLATGMAVQLITARTKVDYLINGTLGVLVVMSRLDGAMFCAGAFAIAALSARRERSWHPVICFSAPILLLYLPYYLIRWDYYGWFFPNLFYTKSAGRAYPSQGLYYAWIYFRCYYVLLLGIATLVWLCIRRRHRALHVPGWSGLRAPATVLALVVPYVLYVVWVGGDFMFGRFLLPVTPLLFLGAQLLVPHLGSWKIAAVVGIAMLVGLVLPATPAKIVTTAGDRGIVDEPTFYGRDHARWMRAVGRSLATHTAGTDTRIQMGAGQAALVWFGRFPVVVDRYGLTDEYIAHLPLEERGRPAYERGKLVPREYFTHERGVHFYFDAGIGPAVVIDDAIGVARNIRFKLIGIEQEPEYAAVRGTPLEWIKGTMLIYDEQLMEELGRRPGIEFTPFPQVLDEYLARVAAGGIGPQQLADDHAGFRAFYFDHNDPERAARFEERLRRALAATQPR